MHFHSIARFTLLTAVLSVVPLCTNPGDPSPGSESDYSVYEPNNVARQATPVMFNDTVVAFIHPERDSDFYTLEIPDTFKAGGVLTASLSPYPGKPQMQWYDSNKAEIGFTYHYSTTQGADLHGWLSVLPGKRYYLMVKDFSSQLSTHPYTLILRFTPVADRFEPNETWQTAPLIQLDSSYQAYLFAGEANVSAEIVDYYRFTFPDSALLKVSVTNVPTNLNIDWIVIDSTGNSVWQYNYTTTDGANLIKTSDKPFAPGTYYIRVKPFTVNSDKVLSGKTNQLPDNAVSPYTIQVTAG